MSNEGGYFSSTEIRRRYAALDTKMQELDLDGVLLITFRRGSSSQEEFYLVQSDYIIAGYSVTFVPRHGEPTTLSNYLQTLSHRAHSTVKDCRVVADNQDPATVIIDLLKERGVDQGRVGWRWGVVPAAWYAVLSSELPRVEWVDISANILDMFYVKSAEEAEAGARSAEIADGGFAHLLKVIEPGITEFDVASEFDNFTTRHGANRNFTLISSGPVTKGAPSPELAPPSRRILERGDSVTLELTPAYAGYYTQLVRTVNVGEVNPWADELHAVAIDALGAATQALRPEVTIGDVAQALMTSVTEAGYTPDFPIGHTVGVDLLYERLLPNSTRVLHEHDTIIIHPRILGPDGAYAFFWGETYLVTATGNDRLNHTSDELQTVGG